ncbi:threonine-phosphate decarboxylase CobD [Halovulum sp. GXIMD14793]
MRDHGGDLDRARAHYGGALEDWIDLSTGINRLPYPLPDLPPHLWQALPDKALFDAACAAARQAYHSDAAILPVAGAQAAIQLLPQIRPCGIVHVVTPTYNEHAASFSASGWDVVEVADISAIPEGSTAVLVNPNNPDGRAWKREALLALAAHCNTLIVDESFGDLCPDLSLAAEASANLIVLRSFGKFYGLAGLRLGFVLADETTIAALQQRAGPWSVSGPALAIGAEALANVHWAEATRARLTSDATRLDQLALANGWPLTGGTDLFRLYEADDAETAQATLARHHIWTRRFPYSKTWLRIGLPGPEAEWQRLETALTERCI